MRSRMSSVFVAMLMSLVVGACAEANRTMTPEAPLYSTESVVNLKIAHGYCVEGKEKTDSKIIQPSAGGTVGVAGNSIEVPKNAVSQPTMFVMKGKAIGCSGTAELRVDLEALQQDEKGDWKVSVGHLGFSKPIRLKLTYEALSDAGDPATLKLVWIRNDGTQVLMDQAMNVPSARAIFAELDHFSLYGIAWPQ